jgi:hypothetical protein
LVWRLLAGWRSRATIYTDLDNCRLKVCICMYVSCVDSDYVWQIQYRWDSQHNTNQPIYIRLISLKLVEVNESTS